MRRVIAAINMTIDGFCDHTVLLPDEEIHQHYQELLAGSEVVLYGSITFLLMKFWQTLLKHPSGEKSMDSFAKAIDRIKKIVFSHKLKTTEWESAELSDLPLSEKVLALKKQEGGDILIGSRSLIAQLMKLKLIDELQICIHPVIAGKGLLLFEAINDRGVFKLEKTKMFSSGAVVNYYQPLYE